MTIVPANILLFSSLTLLAGVSRATYNLKDHYSPSNFFDNFDFWTDADPTSGFVNYVDRDTASSAGYISTTDTQVYIGTNYKDVTPDGRPSVRLSSRKEYNAGTLVILDLQHMPGGICGTWPAFWMDGASWPTDGEIDIIENVNDADTNQAALHTTKACTINNTGNFTGTIYTDDCYVYAADQSSNSGCVITTSNTATYGNGFNEIGGGVYAMEWTDVTVTIWFFPRSDIPSDIISQNPEPSAWSKPVASFSGCDISDHIQNNQIIFDLTFCGSWGNEAWSTSSCASKATTCNDYVEKNPSAFEDAYWLINSLRVYTTS